MAVRVNPRLIEDLEHFGAEDVSKCYHCGNCSAACPFSEEPFIFPRRTMRYLQMGAESRLRSSLSPWLCYSAAIAAINAREAPNRVKP